MKKFNLVVLCLTVCSTLAFAGFSIDWIRTADIFTNSGTSVTRDASDNVYTTTSNGSIYLEKRDRFGNFLWQVNSATTIPFNYEYPTIVHIDPQGYPVVIGYRYTISSEGHFANSLIVLKYDPSGNLLYKKNFDGSYSYFNQSQYWTKVTSQMDNSGNIYIGTAGHVNGYPEWGFNAIKVSPAGNIIRVSTKYFSSSTAFHFVNQIRLKGAKLGLTGATSYANSNATIWVLDTAGTDLWNKVAEGGGGRDVAFNNNGNTFLLTSATVDFQSDVRLYKFSSTGSQTWSKSYDFGGSEIPLRMERTPDGNLAIMASGNTAPNSWYVDWITIKVDFTGNKLWSMRFDKQTHNDEAPVMMAVDANNNIYVTGIAGPYPGGSNLGKRQMVTVKYSPVGVEEWYSAIDSLSEYQTGIGIAIATDGSLFVLGSVTTFIVHYLDHTGSDVCSAPANVSATGITEDGTTVNWNAVSNAYLYHLQFKPSTSATWQQLSTDATSLTLSSLFIGTTYDFRVEAVCNSGPTGYSAIQQFTTLGSGYCASMGLNATKEWIDLVYLGTMLNSTIESDGGYADYTYLKTDLIQGTSYDITLSAGMDPGSFKENWRVWIDYNQDGDFTDADEQEVAYKSMQYGWETHTFQVPLNALTGETRMRVSMKRGNPPQTPCEVFALGEVEDYTVNIIPSKITSPLVPLNDAETQTLIIVYPNPVEDILHVNLDEWEGKIIMSICDLNGRWVMVPREVSGDLLSLNVSEFRNGMYLLRVMDEAGKAASVKWIKE